MSADAAILAMVDQALMREGKRRSRGDWGWVAEVLGDTDVVIARVPRNGNCRRCSAIGTQQGMPKIIRWQGDWQEFDQCGTCGSIGGVNAPYRVVENPTVQTLVEAIRELAGKRSA